MSSTVVKPKVNDHFWDWNSEKLGTLKLVISCGQCALTLIKVHFMMVFSPVRWKAFEISASNRLLAILDEFGRAVFSKEKMRRVIITLHAVRREVSLLPVGKLDSHAC